ncbi:hypothetical protein Syun_019729 [Stephania yunnanensis]|uniref:Uncharacterized protein n=1 Tax=Stephania yunnanensis TaxID=152371 RepID=A0AAP0IUK6_9MAGN
MQYQWLLILSYADDQILAIETVVEKCFPFATHVLDKLDTVVAVDNAIDELSTMIHRKVSILSLALMQWRLILDFLICTLTDWNCDEVKEKEIRVDTNCNERVELVVTTIKDKDVLREFDDDEEEIKNEDKSMSEMEKIKDSTKNAMRPSEDSIVEMFTNKWYT